MKSINNSASATKFFNFDIYNSYISTSTSTSYFDEQVKAIGDYISQQEKTLSYGIGCLKAVSNKYASKSEYNKQMQTIIYDSIDTILNAQSMNNQCQAEFLNILQAVSVEKRTILFDINPNFSNGQTIFVYDTNNNIIGLKYLSSTENTVVPAFKKYALCQSIYTNILAINSIKAEIALANMDDCKDYDNPNNNAGNSSDVYDNPSIAYRKNDKQKGINNGNLVRSDQKTFNGYLLNHGFNFGEATNNNSFRVFSKYESIIQNVLDVFSNQNVDTLYSQIKEHDAQPFSGLIKDIINILLIDDTNTNTFISEYNNGCSSRQLYTLQYNSGVCTTPSTSNICDLLSVTNTNSTFTGFTLYGQCLSTGKMTVIVEAEHPLLGYVFDIEYDGEGIGAQTTSTIQACMATFSSGGSNDKDACRDVITKKCGMNIDYQCKKSGFYDYINANPNSVPLPKECNLGPNSCFNWIEQFFYAGQVIVKPSAFIGYNLYLSTSTKDKTDVLKSMNYQSPDLTGNVIDINSYNALQKHHNNANKNIKILGSSITNQADISEKTVLMDRGAYKILHDGAKPLSFGLLILLLNLVLIV